MLVEGDASIEVEDRRYHARAARCHDDFAANPSPGRKPLVQSACHVSRCAGRGGSGTNLGQRSIHGGRPVQLMRPVARVPSGSAATIPPRGLSWRHSRGFRISSMRILARRGFVVATACLSLGLASPVIVTSSTSRSPSCRERRPVSLRGGATSYRPTRQRLYRKVAATISSTSPWNRWP